MNQENDKDAINLSDKSLESSLEFQNGQWSPGSYSSSATPRIIDWLVEYSGGLIKDEKQATYVILGFVVLAVITSIFLIFGRGGGSEKEKSFAPPAEAPAEEVVPFVGF